MEHETLANRLNPPTYSKESPRPVVKGMGGWDLKDIYSRLLDYTGNPAMATALMAGGAFGTTWLTHRLLGTFGRSAIERALGPEAADNFSGSSPFVPSLLAALAAGGLTAYEVGPTRDPKSSWFNWDHYKEKRGLPFTNKGASLASDGAMHNPLRGLQADVGAWDFKRPSIGIRTMERNIWEVPGMNDNQRAFLDAGLKTAVGGKPAGMTSLTDLSAGYARTLSSTGVLNNVGGAATGAALGWAVARVAGPLLGGSAGLNELVANAGAVSGALTNLPILRNLQ
jgi:hypothetical protein